MTKTIYAPYPDTEHIVILPDPELGDSERQESRVQTLTMMNGDIHTTKKTVENKTYRWQFQLTDMKAIELYRAFEDIAGKLWKVDELIGYVKLNPLALTFDNRGVYGNSRELVAVEMEFETVQ